MNWARLTVSPVALASWNSGAALPMAGAAANAGRICSSPGTAPAAVATAAPVRKALRSMLWLHVWRDCVLSRYRGQPAAINVPAMGNWRKPAATDILAAKLL
ncbi:hypothetical protein STHU_28020 [Allostella humosa]|nr:hypothetical protein STHU_28020 [Stella humosa]